jgi:hypothetical protein
MPDALNAAWYASLAAESLLLWRLFHLRLPLPWFKGYLAVNLLQAMFFLILAPRPSARGYEAVWISSEPVLLLLMCAAAVEGCTRVRESFPGLGSFGRWIIAGFSVAAALICFASIGPDLHAANWQRPLLTWAILAKRAISTAGSLALAIVLGFLVFMHARIARNVLMHARLLCIYMAIPAIGSCLLLLNIGSSRSVSIGSLCAATLCFLGWSVLLSRKGEERPPPSRVATQEELDASWNAIRALVRAIDGVFR